MFKSPYRSGLHPATLFRGVRLLAFRMTFIGVPVALLPSMLPAQDDACQVPSTAFLVHTAINGAQNERVRAVYELGKKGEDAQCALMALRSLVNDDPGKLRYYSAVAIVKIEGPHDMSLLPVLQNGLTAHDGGVKYGCAIQLSKYGVAALPYLQSALKEGDGGTRAYACLALGELGENNDEAITILSAVLAEDPSDNVRLAAVKALAHKTTTQAKTALLAATNDPNEQVRRTSERALQSAGLQAREIPFPSGRVALLLASLLIVLLIMGLRMRKQIRNQDRASRSGPEHSP